MYKKDVVRWVARSIRLPQEDVSDVIDAMHKLVQEELHAGRPVTFPGFGTFSVSKRPGGTVRHVKTKQAIEYDAFKLPVFKAGEVLKRAVKGQKRKKSK